MNAHYKFYKKVYKRHFLAFPLLIIVCSIFLFANISNIYDQQSLLLNSLFAIFHICLIILSAFCFTRLIKVGKPYLALTLDGFEYADIWHARQLIRYEDISKTMISTRTPKPNLIFKLYIFIWDHKLQAKTGFSRHKKVFNVNVDAQQYHGINHHFPTLLTLLKQMNRSDRKELLLSLETNLTDNILE